MHIIWEKMSDKVCKSTRKCNTQKPWCVLYEENAGHLISVLWNATRQLAYVFAALYIVWSSYEISSLKSELGTVLQRLEDPQLQLMIEKSTFEGFGQRISDGRPADSWDAAKEVYHLDRLRRSANTSRSVKVGEKKKRRKRKRRRRCKCKDGKAGATGPIGPRGPQGKTGQSFATLAGHFVATRPDVERHEASGCVIIWNGTYCNGNATYVNREPVDVLQFFENNHSVGNIPSPFKSTDHGEFVVRQEGLMLFYFTIAVYSKGPFKDTVALYVDHDRIMKCIETKDWTSHSDISPFFNAKEKTCSATGVHYVQKNQVVRLKVLSRETPITLFPDMTFFGAVLLR